MKLLKVKIPEMVFPSRGDARFLQAAVLIGYAVTAREIFHFERSHLVTLLCILWAVILDLLFGFFKFKKLVFPLSALIIALASSLLIYARSPYPYLAVVTLAISSKALITYKAKHLFNPANFGVVAMLLLAPDSVTGMPALFSGYMTPSVIFAVLGLLTVIYAHQAEVSLSWVIGFVIFAFVRSQISGAPVVSALLPFFGPSFLLFSFHMISDPATTPRTRGYRIAYGLFAALLDAAFRFFQIPYGMFYSLFIVCCFLPWIRDHEGATIERLMPVVPAQVPSA
jgi:enediyne biosynthesis protein E5